MNKKSHYRWRLDPYDERLWDGDKAIKLTPKAFKVLHYFVSNPHRLLTKDEILSAVWGDIAVTEGLVKEYVADLRKALKDDPREPDYIETIHGRGYRLIGDISIDDASTAEEPVSVASEKTSVQRSTNGPVVAVIPFDTLVCEPRWKFIAEGICDDIITDLTRFPDLNLIARTSCAICKSSVINMRQIGNELGATYILMGSLQESNNNLRIHTHLVDVKSEKVIWADRYECHSEDLFSLQDTIVERVATSLGGFQGEIVRAERVRLGRKRPCNLNAYEFYLLGYECEAKFDFESTKKGIQYVEEAVRIDPYFAAAWNILGFLCNNVVAGQLTEDTEEYAVRARQARLRAVELDSGDPVAIIECGGMFAREGNLENARDCFIRARDLGVNNVDAIIMLSKYTAFVLGQMGDAVALLDRAFKFNPHAPKWYYLHKQRIAYFNRDFNAVVEAAKHSVDDIETDLFEIMALAQMGNCDAISSMVPAFNKRYPHFDSESFIASLSLVHDDCSALFRDGISKAGINTSLK